MDVTDTFNRADNATVLGTTSDGNATWTTDLGTWGIASNQAAQTSATSNSHAHIDTAVANGTVQVTLAAMNTSSGAGPMFRRADSSNYWVIYCRTGNVTRLSKVVAGVFNNITSWSASVAGDIVAVTFNGTSITVKQNGTTVATTTDSFNQSSTQHGIYVDGVSTPRLDDWSFVGIATPFHRPRIMVAQRAALTRAARF